MSEDPQPSPYLLFLWRWDEWTGDYVRERCLPPPAEMPEPKPVMENYAMPGRPTPPDERWERWWGLVKGWYKPEQIDVYQHDGSPFGGSEHGQETPR